MEVFALPWIYSLHKFLFDACNGSKNISVTFFARPWKKILFPWKLLWKQIYFHGNFHGGDLKGQIMCEIACGGQTAWIRAEGMFLHGIVLK